MRFTANLGKREHLHCSAVGKAMLAAMPAGEVHEIVAAAGHAGEDAAHDHRGARAARRARGGRAPRLRDRRRGGRRGRLLRRLGDLRPHGACVGAVSVTGSSSTCPCWRVEQIGAGRARTRARISALLGAPAATSEAVRVSRRALVVDGPGSIALEERAELAPGPRRSRRPRRRYCGLCGTDLELLRGEVDPAFVRYPLTLGHEWSGTVEAVGAGRRGHRAGRCAASPRGSSPADTARAAGRARRTSARPTTRSASRARAGRATRSSSRRASCTCSTTRCRCSTPRSSSRPRSCSPGSRRRARARASASLVVGDGTIALLAVLLAGSGRPREIVVAGRRPEQEELALDARCDRLHDGGARRAGFDLAIEAAGATAGGGHRGRLAPARRHRPHSRAAARGLGARAARPTCS